LLVFFSFVFLGLRVLFSFWVVAPLHHTHCV
jgi:hypothetical protein